MQNTTRLFLKFVFLFSAAVFFKFAVAQKKGNNEMIAAARSVIERAIGSKANSITLEQMPCAGKNDVYQLEAKNGRLIIRGSSATAIAYAFNSYLQKACHSMITWSGQHLQIPSRWPNYKEETVTSPYQYRYYLNVVTFGYTTPYWDWKRWEKELDWMALHGVNMPLATVASEAIARRVWRKLGLTDTQIAEFFTGPAHFPWHRMGNLNKWDGPVPLSWHADQIKLQHRILKRMRDLGMHPVAPAFAGFVPQAFQKIHSEVPVKHLTWGGFPEQYNAFVMAPNTDYFEQIGKLFIQEWEKEFGKNDFYLSDSFNEMDVPVSKNDTSAKYKLLSGYGSSIYKSIVAGNPDATWVTQGWTFGYQNKFWDGNTLRALLKNVPDDKMIILDLANEFPKYVWHIQQTWKTQEGFHGKKWVYSYVPNFGGKTTYTGDLSLYASGSAEALNSPYAKTLVGFGSAPEGIENNEVIYELIADMGWSRNTIDLDGWLSSYSLARYGAFPESMREAWTLLRSSVYGSFSSYPRFTWQTVLPDQKRKSLLNTSSEFLQAVKKFLEPVDQLKSSKLYCNDAIELSALYLSIKADDHYKLALHADSVNQIHQRDSELTKAVNLLLVVDRLLQSHPSDRLQPWVEMARAHGTSPEQKNYYESNAKRLITSWGAAQSDYAARMWSGLIKDYYVPRMQIQLSDNRNDLHQWEESWIKQQWKNTTQPYKDPLSIAVQMVNEN